MDRDHTIGHWLFSTYYQTPGKCEYLPLDSWDRRDAEEPRFSFIAASFSWLRDFGVMSFSATDLCLGAIFPSRPLIFGVSSLSTWSPFLPRLVWKGVGLSRGLGAGLSLRDPRWLDLLDLVLGVFLSKAKVGKWKLEQICWTRLKA